MAKLTTPYVKKMDRECPHSYHPTPQFKRDGYLSLNGQWDYCQATTEAHVEFTEKILVNRDKRHGHASQHHDKSQLCGFPHSL